MKLEMVINVHITSNNFLNKNNKLKDHKKETNAPGEDLYITKNIIYI